MGQIARDDLEEALRVIDIKSKLPETLEEARERHSFHERKADEAFFDAERAEEDGFTEMAEEYRNKEQEHEKQIWWYDDAIEKLNEYGEPDYEALELERRRIQNYLSDTYETEEVPA